MSPATSPEEEFIVIEELDLGDESELRQLVAEVEGLVRAPGPGLRVSVLTADQWKTVLQKVLPAHLRRGQERYIHTLRDPGDPRHLLVSPSAVRGINEGSRAMYQEILYALLSCLPTELGLSLRRGVNDLIAESIGERLEIEVYVKNYPEEAALVRALLMSVVSEFDHTLLDWALEMRRRPELFMRVLDRSGFGRYWAGQDDYPPLSELLATERLDLASDPIKRLVEALEAYMEESS